MAEELAEPPSLRSLQRRFAGLVTAPESVTRTLAARGETERSLDGFVRGDGRLSAAERLDVYANMYFFRLLDVLRDAYPRVAAVLGATAFHNLVTAYLAACPPRHHSIATAGDRLPAFLQGHPLAGGRPWLPALARLERAYVELFDGPDAARPLTIEQLRTLGPEALAALRLAPIPCLALLTHGFAVGALWERIDEGGELAEAGDVAAAPEAIIVWRQDVTVYHRRLDQDELPLLRLVRRGTTIAALCDVAAAGVGVGGEVDQAAVRVFELVFRWVQDGLLEGFRG